MNLVKATRSENASCEHQGRISQERIIFIEKIFSELCSVSALYARKSAGERDANDKLAKSLKSYSTKESINKTLKKALEDFGNTLIEIGSYRNIEVKQLEKKVVEELKQYEGICHSTKEEVKSIFSVHDRELTWRKQLDKIKEKNPLNRQQITTAESELVKATVEVSRTQRALEEQMNLFEKRKLQDLKSILMDFVKIQLSLNAKLIELFTRGYQELMLIDEEEDLEDFGNVLKIPETQARLETVRKTSLRHSSLLATLFSTPRKPSHKGNGSNENNLLQTTISTSDLVETLKSNSEEVSEFDENDSADEDDNEEDDELSSILSDENVSNEFNKKLLK